MFDSYRQGLHEGRGYAALVCFCLIALCLAGPGPAAEQDVLLRMMVWQHEGDRALSGTTDLLAAFYREDPHIRINLNHDRWSQALPNIRYWCGTLRSYAPDLTVMPDAWLPQFANSLLPLDEYLKDRDLSGILPSVLERGRVNGKLLGLPWMLRSRVLYYRQDLFDKLKLKPPKTLDELRTVAAALREEQGMAPLGLPAGSGGGAVDAFWGLYLAAAGGPEDKDKEPLATTRAVEALQYWLDLQHEALTQPEALTWTSAELDQAFADGKLGMVFSGPALAKYLKAERPELKFGLGPLPGQTDSLGQISSEVLVVFSSTTQPVAAVRFARFMASGEAQRALWLMGGLPTHRQHLKQAAHDPALAPFVGQLEHAAGLPLADTGALTRVVESALWLALSGRMTAAEALREARTAEQKSIF